jgi:hypothetical protein
MGMAFLRSGLSRVSHRTRSRSSTRIQLTRLTVDRGGPRYRSSVGFNPFREHSRTTTDIVIMVIAFIAIFAVVGWAIFSG